MTLDPALTRRQLAAIAAVAFLARTFNLPWVPFSLWLDEILILRRATGAPIEILRACLANAEHPPLVAFVLALGQAAGFSETQHRVLPIALGTTTCVLLAVWTARRWGPAAGFATGLAAALSPYGVRFSQEIRPYPFLGFLVLLALVLADRLSDRPTRARWLALVAACLAGFYTHMLFGLVAVVFSWPLGEALVGRRRPARAELAAAAALGAAFLLYVPWIAATAGRVAARADQGDVAQLTPRWLGQRWQFLTVGGVERDPITWGAFLWLAAVLAGAVAAARTPAGRAVLAAVVGGLVIVEGALRLGNHWSAGRYNFFAWLFLPVLVGIVWSWSRARLPRAVRIALLAAFVTASSAGLARYARVGRPDWRAVIETVRDVRERAGERVPVWVLHRANGPVVEYYLRLDAVRPRRIGIHRDPESLDAALDRGEAAILVTTTYPRNTAEGPRKPSTRMVLAGRFERANTRVLATPGLVPNAPVLDPEPAGAEVLRAVESIGWIGRPPRRD